MKNKIRVLCLIAGIMCLVLACGQDNSSAGSESQSQQETESQVENNSQVENDSQVESESEIESESQVESESEVGTEPEVGTDNTEETTQEPDDTETESQEPEIVYTYEDMEKTMYTTTNLNVRKGPSTEFDKIGGLELAQEVSVTGQCKETGWYRIKYQEGVGYVSSDYLTETQPELPQPVTYYDTGDAELNDLCDYILDEIVDDSMTEREAAYAVYCWVEDHIKYRGSTDTSSWISGAKTALTTYKGNCFAYYSASRALLTRLGFENTMATTYTFSHYWNMVKVEGSWWHFDTTTGWGTQRFLWTSEQLLAYRHYNSDGTSYIQYHWNPEGCPETP